MNINITAIGPMTAKNRNAARLAALKIDDLEGENDRDWFDPKVELGGRGFKYFSQATRYMLAAIKQLEQSPNMLSEEDLAGQVGIVVGSNSCTRKILDEMDETVLEKGCSAINPMYAPSFCANVGTGNLSIKKQAKAFNITLVNPITAGLEAVVVAKKAILEGRASSVIAGAMEDDSTFSLAANYPVQTFAGAWAIRMVSEHSLQCAETENYSNYAQIGKTISRFLPSGAGLDTEIENGFSQRLEQELQSILSNSDGLKIVISALKDQHSQKVFELFKKVVDKYEIPNSNVIMQKNDFSSGTLLPLAQLSWLCLNARKGLCVAISPLGHFIAIEIIQL